MKPQHQPRTDERARPATRERQRQVVLREGASSPSLVTDAPAPAASEGMVLLRTLLAGIDGTDEELLRGSPAPQMPAGSDALVMGHECLAEVVEAPEGSGLAPGDRVVPLVRHGCGRCEPCARGHQDMCRTGDYLEHGIKGLDGFMRDEWTDHLSTLVKAPATLGDLAVLTEPLSVAVKAVEMAELIQRRLPDFDGFRDQRVLLAGTGSLGALAAFLLRERGARVWAMDRTGDDAFGNRLLARLGVEHFNARETSPHDVAREVGNFDFVLEATGAPGVAFDLLTLLDNDGVACLLGVPPEKDAVPLEADDMMRRLVLGNGAVFGSVNSNRGHFERALEALGRFRDRWPGLIGDVLTHRYCVDEIEEAFRADDRDLVKKVVDWRQ